jgi:hypothetical protein
MKLLPQKEQGISEEPLAFNKGLFSLVLIN